MNTTIKKIHEDFTKTDFKLLQFDGLLMANSLHYVSDQKIFINRLKNSLKSFGRILLVEYDTDAANPWVPYPVSFKSLQALARNTGFDSAFKIGQEPSLLNRSNIYSAVLKMN